MIQTFICPKCFKNVVIDVSEPDIAIIGNTIDNGKVIDKGHHFEVWCKDCDELMFECDASISACIIKMNKVLGLKTMYCCEGHFHRDVATNKFVHFSVPFVKFKVQDIKQLSNSIIAAYKARENENATNIITIDAHLQDDEEGLVVDISGNMDMVDIDDNNKANTLIAKFYSVLAGFIVEYEKLLAQGAKIGSNIKMAKPVPTNDTN